MTFLFYFQPFLLDGYFLTQKNFILFGVGWRNWLLRGRCFYLILFIRK